MSKRHSAHFRAYGSAHKTGHVNSVVRNPSCPSHVSPGSRVPDHPLTNLHLCIVTHPFAIITLCRIALGAGTHVDYAEDTTWLLCCGQLERRHLDLRSSLQAGRLMPRARVPTRRPSCARRRHVCATIRTGPIANRARADRRSSRCGRISGIRQRLHECHTNRGRSSD